MALNAINIPSDSGVIDQKSEPNTDHVLSTEDRRRVASVTGQLTNVDDTQMALNAINILSDSDVIDQKSEPNTDHVLSTEDRRRVASVTGQLTNVDGTQMALNAINILSDSGVIDQKSEPNTDHVLSTEDRRREASVTGQLTNVDDTQTALNASNILSNSDVIDQKSQPNQRSQKGRRPKVEKNVKETIFDSYMDRLLIQNRIVNSSNEVYYEIAEKLHMEKQAVYLAAKRYINEKVPQPQTVYKEDKNDEFVPSEYFDSNFKVCGDDTSFTINISNIDLFDKDTTKLLESLEWCDTINEILWEFSRLPCAWRFNRLRSVCNEYVFSGRCASNDCSKVFGYTEANSTVLKVIIKSFKDNMVHNKKRSTKYSRKEEIHKMLKLNNACVVRAKLANDMMIDHDDYEPAHLPHTEALRVQKNRANKSEYFHDNPILSIRNMKKTSKYCDTIGDIGLAPFYCFYSTPLQRELLRDLTRYKKCIISFDASGLPEIPPEFSSVREDEGTYKRTFIYIVSLQTENFKMPVFQYFSQRQNSDFIIYASACWRTKCFHQRNPDEVIVDDSSALLLSSIQCFTSCKTMQEYLNRCYDALFTDRVAPECYIRLDRAHIVKIIMRMECMKNEDNRRKHLYRRVFGYLMKATDPKIVETALKCIFILLNNKYENDEFVVDAKKCLKVMSNSHTVEINEREEIPETEDDNDKVTPETLSDKKKLTEAYSSNTKIRMWIDEIASDISKNHVNKSLNDSLREEQPHLVDNVFYAPHLQNPFIQFLVQIPLFSNIMNQAFGSTNFDPSSGITEAGFKVLKKDILQNKTRMRLDKILEAHIEYLAGSLRQYGTKHYRTVDQSENSDDNDIITHRTYEVYEENWRNKNSDAKVAKLNCGNANRVKNSILDPITPHVRKVPTLKNGHRIIGTKKILGILSTQTCAFDSLFQILAVCYTDLQCISNKMLNDTSELSQLIKNLFEEKYDVCKQRTNLLLSLFPEKALKYGNNVTALDCEMSIHKMFQKLSTEYPIIQSFEEYKKCSSCTYTSPKVRKSYVPTDLKSIDLRNLQFSIKFTQKPALCRSCQAELVICRQFNHIISFDVEKSCDDEKKTILIVDISKHIEVGQKTYMLRAIIEHTTNHYKSHIRRNDDSWETYDDMYPESRKKTPKKLVPVFLVYSEGIHDRSSSDGDSTTLQQQDVNGYINTDIAGHKADAIQDRNSSDGDSTTLQQQDVNGYINTDIAGHKADESAQFPNIGEQTSSSSTRKRRPPKYLQSYTIGKKFKFNVK